MKIAEVQEEEKWVDTRTWMAAFYWEKFSSGLMPLEFLITSLVSKEIMLGRYNIALIYKLCLPIEKIAQEEKMKLVEECRATGLKFTNKSLTDAAKILYTLKKIGI